MAIVDPNDLLRHASSEGYDLPIARVALLDPVIAILSEAEEAHCPIVVSISETELNPLSLEVAMPAIEVAAERATIPLVLCLDGAADERAIIRAARLGFGMVALADRAPVDALEALAARCGIMLFRNATATLAPMEARFGVGEPGLRTLNAAGKASGALAAARRRRLVEHVVMFNAPDLTEPEVEELFRIGCEQLGAVPGVRGVRVGRAITPRPRYSLCWIVRFANEAVAESYKHDPMHLAFADNRFRPVATDRLTIDFLLR